MAHLRCVCGGPIQAEPIVSKDEISLGRDARNDVVIQDGSVSREHSRIVRTGTSFVISDLGSRNSTLVNGEACSGSPLKDGDQILIGETLFVFKCDPDGEQKPAVLEILSATMDTVTQTMAQTAQKSLDADVTGVESLNGDRDRVFHLFYEIGRSLNSSLTDYGAVLEKIVSTLFSELRAERAFVALIDPESQELCYEIIRDKNKQNLEPDQIKISKTIIFDVYNNRRAILTKDAISDERLKHVKSIIESQVLSAMCAPLLYRDQVLGILYADNCAQTGIFSDIELELFATLGNLAGIAIGNARLYRKVSEDVSELRSKVSQDTEVVGQGVAITKVMDTVRKVADSEISVLIRGETGTGKELVARTLHGHSVRRDGPFIALNCGAIPETLFESELFGYAAQSGIAGSDPKGKPGKFELAASGTLFLDEIGEMPLSMQVKLLRTLQERVVERLSGTQSIPVDVRVLSATNKDLSVEMKEGRFRQDLFFRLRGIEVEVPPLRERHDDIEDLTRYFLEKFSLKNRKQIRDISPKAIQLLRAFSWEGNVRELENAIEHAVVLCDGDVLWPEDLPYQVRHQSRTIASPFPGLSEMERDHIVKVLRHHNWNITRSAEVLGIARKTVHEKIKVYGLTREKTT